MKKSLIIGITGAIISLPVMAATKCVKLTSDTTCSLSSSTLQYKSDWSIACGGVAVSGIAKCSSTASSVVGATHLSVDVSSSPIYNKYCKCKMVSPAVSRWVNVNICTDMNCLLPGANTSTECDQWCANGCKQGFGIPSFRTAIFSNLSD